MATMRPCLTMATLVYAAMLASIMAAYATAADNEDEGKRFVLDGEVDLQTLTNEVRALKSSNQLLTNTVNTLQTSVASLTATVNTLQQSAATGSTYVRWGKKTCPLNSSSLVYSGFAGGSYYSSPGGAANTVCLPQDPQWGYYEDTHQSGAHMYGTEYETCDYHSGCGKKFFPGLSKSNDEDVPCAVCQSKRSETLMIPARLDCYSGWHKEYSGYLMAGAFDHQSATEYVCVDGHPDVLAGGDDNREGRVFYFVEGRCGSLKCPPYVNGRELTCVVCTK